MKRTIFIVLLLLLTGCSSVPETNSKLVTGNPTPEDFLQYEDADIFQLNGVVYSNADDVEWVLKTNYTVGDEIGEITKQSDEARSFSNGTANVLPVGTKIYDTDAPFLIVVINDKEIPYLPMIEG